MNPHFKSSFAAVVLFCSVISLAARAQTFTSLTSFNGQRG